MITNKISEQDLRFLGAKYMERDGQMMVFYWSFIDDYDAIEKMGLGATIN